MKNLKTPAFRCSLDGNHFENGAFRKRCRHDHDVIQFLEGVFLKHTSKMTRSFSNSSAVVWAGPQALVSGRFSVVWPSWSA